MKTAYLRRLDVLSALLALALTGTVPLAAQVPAATAPLPARLDLPAALTYALDHNFAIRQARERIREQEGLILEIRSQALPNVELGSSYTRTDPSLSADRGGGMAASDENWAVALEVRQLLYAGGGVSAALDAQRLVREAALLELQSVINDALLDVRTRFYDALLSREQIIVQEQNLELLEQQLLTARNRFEAGAVSNFDVLRAEVDLANAQPPLIRARNNYRIALEELRRAIGDEPGGSARPDQGPELMGSLEVTPTLVEFTDAIISARQNRPELKRLAALTEAREAGVDIARAGYKPDLALVGGYQVRSRNDSSRFNDAIDGWTVGLQSSWAIFDGRATAGRVAQARSQLEQARLLREESELAVEVEVRRALSSLQEAAELVSAAGRVVGQAEEAARLADARYRAGSATQLDLLVARTALTEARNNQLEANYSYNVAVANMRRAMGLGDAAIAR